MCCLLLFPPFFPHILLLLRSSTAPLVYLNFISSSLTPKSSSALFFVSVFIYLFFCFLVRLFLSLSLSSFSSWVFQVSTLTPSWIFQILASSLYLSSFFRKAARSWFTTSFPPSFLSLSSCLCLCLSVSLCYHLCHSRSLARTLFRVSKAPPSSLLEFFLIIVTCLYLSPSNCPGPSSRSLPLYLRLPLSVSVSVSVCLSPFFSVCLSLFLSHLLVWRFHTSSLPDSCIIPRPRTISPHPIFPRPNLLPHSYPHLLILALYRFLSSFFYFLSFSFIQPFHTLKSSWIQHVTNTKHTGLKFSVCFSLVNFSTSVY